MSIKILLVDDSAVVRGLIAKALTVDPEITIVARASNGELAIQQAKETQPDLIILDLEMPVMDGLTALPQLLKAAPQSRVLIASTLSARNAAISFKALELGATDYLTKPSTQGSSESEEFFRELLRKVKAIGMAKPAAKVASSPLPSSMSLNPAGTRALAIASSTGGPQALASLLTQLKGKLPAVAIFITQHMPPTFTAILADHLSKAGGRPCVEVKGGEVVQAGHAYLAPGDYHMVAEKNQAGEVVLRINQDPPENFCRPAADPMLRSLSAIYGNQLALAVLTGMGQDALEGARLVVKNGGGVIAQNEASCVVYGMPKAVAENRLCKAVLPLDDMGNYLIQQIDGDA